MFVNPKKAIEKGWITGIKDEKQIQPNAIDITADKMFELNRVNVFEINCIAIDGLWIIQIYGHFDLDKCTTS